MPVSKTPVGWLGLAGFLCVLHSPLIVSAGTWVTNTNAPGLVGVALVLSDASILAQRGPGYSNWFRLSPDSQGHYANGSWTANSGLNMANIRQFFASDVLPNGKVLVVGGEYGAPGSGQKAELYDPGANQWTPLNVPAGLVTTNLFAPNGYNGGFADAPSIVLSDGTVLIAPIYPVITNGTVIYDPNANSWSAGPATRGPLFITTNGTVFSSLNEVSWVKLPDDSILTIDASQTTTERYIPSLKIWIKDRNIPVAMYSSAAEIGAALLLPDGRALFLGGTGNTLYYTPSGNTNQGTWTVGPVIPGGLVARDAPAAMMANGNVLCAFSPTTGDSPIFFYELNPTNNVFTAETGPTGTASYTNDITDQTAMLALPDGNILFTAAHNQTVYIYQPAGSPVAAWKPAIAQTSYNTDGSLHVAGTQLNGLSQGAAFGDDNQMDSNYPLLRFTDGGGIVYYGHTRNWSSTSVQTGNQLVTTECDLPANIFNGPGTYSIQAVANGIASDPATFYGPVWVDFGFNFPTMTGTYALPYNTLALGISAVTSGGTILIKPGLSHETMTISKPMTISAVGGTAIIGQ